MTIMKILVTGSRDADIDLLPYTAPPPLSLLPVYIEHFLCFYFFFVYMVNEQY